MYEIVEEKMIRNITNSVGQRTALSLVHIVCDTAADMPEPLPHWISGSRCDVLENGGSVYLLSSHRTWTNVNFYNQGGEGGGFDPDAYYTKPQTDAKITEKVAEIVADAPEDFNTLKEMSDWIASHEESAAAMNSAIQQNTTAIAGKVDKVAGKGLSTNDYTTEEKTKLADLENYDDAQIYEAINSLGRSIGTLGLTVEEKVDKVSGKGLSTEDYTTAEKTKLAGIASGAEVNVQSDWNQTDSSADDFIKNKPTVPTVDQTFDATSQNAQSGVAIAGILSTTPLFSETIKVDLTLYKCTEDYVNGYRKFATYKNNPGLSTLIERANNDLPSGVYMAINDYMDNTIDCPVIILVNAARSYPVFIYSFVVSVYHSSSETPELTRKYRLDENTRYYKIGDI